MTALIILALLASNIFLAKMVLSKEDKKTHDTASTVAEPPPPEEKSEATTPAESATENAMASVVGASKYDPDTYRNIVKDIVKEVVPLIMEEYGNFADAGLPEPPAERASSDSGVVPNEKLDDVFSYKTVSDLTGEDPEPTEPRAEGIDFDSLNKTMDVLKDKSDKPEDMLVAQKTLGALDGTEIKEKLSLDPAIQKKILLVELYVPEEAKQSSEKETSYSQPNDETATKPKKLLFHADIDTKGIDGIDLNVYH